MISTSEGSGGFLLIVIFVALNDETGLRKQLERTEGYLGPRLVLDKNQQPISPEKRSDKVLPDGWTLLLFPLIDLYY